MTPQLFEAYADIVFEKLAFLIVIASLFWTGTRLADKRTIVIKREHKP